MFSTNSLFDGYLIEPLRKRFNGQESSLIAISCVFDAYLMEIYLMTIQLSFTITTKFIDFISAISERVGFGQWYFFNASVNAPANLMLVHTDQVSDYVGDQVCQFAHSGG